jgi:hypothetical protein
MLFRSMRPRGVWRMECTASGVCKTNCRCCDCRLGALVMPSRHRRFARAGAPRVMECWSGKLLPSLRPALDSLRSRRLVPLPRLSSAPDAGGAWATPP